MNTAIASGPNPIRIALIAGALTVVIAGAMAAVDDLRRQRIRVPEPMLGAAAVSGDPVDPSMASARQRGKRIQDELRQLGSRHPWAGTYRWSSGFDYLEVSLAPRSGAVMRAGSDVIGPEAYFECPVRVGENAVVHLQWSPLAMPSASGFLSAELIPVRWGERRYLLPPSALHGFVERIHRGQEPRVDLVSEGPGNRRDGGLLRAGDEFKPVWGLPQLPSGTLPGLRLAPQPVAVLDVRAGQSNREGDDCRIAYRFALDMGSREGLQVGEELVTSSSDGHERMRLERVGPRQSVAVLDRHGCRSELAALRKAKVSRAFYNPIAAQTELAAVMIERQRKSGGAD
ncbi:hypothetical protein [Lysobacter sp. Root690]|uniref:hypothetical protein n=1 Tax=Lysobacter sp. Root690 TaxID=1736588 RepID=UPI000A5D4505|nr:hypothetical protein [Lysobacter sp. Root690]